MIKNYLVLVLFLTCMVSTTFAQEWETIKTFEGNGITNTGAFTIEENEWRVTYSSESTSDVGHIFQLYLHKPKGDLVNDILANQTNKKDVDGTSHVYKTGRFYFKVNAANGNWTIKVQVPSETKSNYSNNSSEVELSVEKGQIDARNSTTLQESLQNIGYLSDSKKREFQHSLVKLMASKLDMSKMVEISEAEKNGKSVEGLLLELVENKIHGKTVDEVITTAEETELDETQQKLYKMLKNSDGI